jgi:hypothetical protein
MFPFAGLTRKMSELFQKSGGTVPGLMPLSSATLHTNKDTPASPPSKGGGMVPMTSLGTSFILPAVIQLPNTSTSFGAGALT